LPGELFGHAAHAHVLPRAGGELLDAQRPCQRKPPLLRRTGRFPRSWGRGPWSKPSVNYRKPTPNRDTPRPATRHSLRSKRSDATRRRIQKRQRAAALHDASRHLARKNSDRSWSAAVPDRKVLCRFGNPRTETPIRPPTLPRLTTNPRALRSPHAQPFVYHPEMGGYPDLYNHLLGHDVEGYHDARTKKHEVAAWCNGKRRPSLPVTR
jgi:hypothetical protein